MNEAIVKDCLIRMLTEGVEYFSAPSERKD